MKLNQLIGDRYRITAPIGEGGMANVYRAFDTILQRDVTVKILRFDLRDKDVVRKRFENEIAATAEVNHPNIVQIYDFGDEDDDQYLVSEFVDGTDLKHYIQDEYPISFSKIVDIMSQILAGVAEAHEHGIIHRDLKPQNVLIASNGQVKITDFGIAQVETSLGLTQTNSAIGSVHYMSPEQVKGRPATVRSDIYALGIMLYEMLAGHVPFDGETPVAVAVKHTQEPIPSVREIDARIPQAMENVIIRATAKNPLQRYVSANEMNEDLVTVLSPARVNESRLLLPGEEMAEAATKVLPLHEVQQLTSATPEVIKAATNEDAPKTSKTENGKKAKIDPKKKKKKRRRIILAIIVAILVLLGGLWAIGAMSPDRVTISNLNGQTQSAAEKTLKQDGLKVGKISTTASNVTTGSVVRTNPGANKVVDKGSSVDLVVSSGPKKERFGDYVNERYTTVASQLRAKGYTVHKEEAASDIYPAGYIVSQSVKAEKQVVPGDTSVTFVVSTGEAKLTVPDFSNKSQSYVSNWASQNGVIVNYTQAYSDTVQSGNIMNQSIAAGTTITKNQALYVTVSKGANEQSSSSSSESSSTSTSSSSSNPANSTSPTAS